MDDPPLGIEFGSGVAEGGEAWEDVCEFCRGEVFALDEGSEAVDATS